MTETINHDDIARRASQLIARRDRLAARLAAAGGADVTVLPVSKGHPVEAALAAASVGLSMLGENYAQELAAKAETMQAERAGPIDWHFIGQLQTNKVRLIADRVAVWQSVDRLKVGREIAKRAPGAVVFGQVNLSAEPQKAGCPLDQVDELVAGLRDLDLQVEGLMGVGTDGDPTRTASGFAALRAAVDRLELTHCSMGMSADLELAIDQGSTMVRVGSDLFGPRP